MPRHPITWIVMADGSRARIVKRREEAPGFEVVAEPSSESLAPSREIWSDRPGRTQESASSAHHAIEPRQDPHDAQKTRFLQHLADELNRAAAEKRFSQLILFAPPRCLAELRQTLDETTRHMIKAEAPKDLTKLPIAELEEHVQALT